MRQGQGQGQGQGSKRSRGRGNPGRRNSVSRNNNFDSNGPSVRIRGTATQVYEKYLQLARDATTSGDRVTAENMYQHAEHYFRIINVDRDDGQPSRDNNAEGARENGDRQPTNDARRPVNDGEQPRQASLQEQTSPQEDAGEVKQDSPPNLEEQLPQFLVRDDTREKPVSRTPRRANGRTRPRTPTDQAERPKRISPKPEEAEAVVLEPAIVEFTETVQSDATVVPEVSENVAGD